MAELQLPLPIAYSPLSRMLAAVEIDGVYTRFSGIQRPAPTDPTTATDTYEYSEGSDTIPGATTPGNVSLVFTHVPGNYVDDFLSEKDGQLINLQFITRGSLAHTPNADARLVAAAAATTGKEKGLSELTPALLAGSSATGWDAATITDLVRAGTLRENLVIELDSVDTAEAAQVALDLSILEPPRPTQPAGTSKVSEQTYELYIKGQAAIVAADIAKAGTPSIRFFTPSTIWQVQGTLLTYTPQFDLNARSARIEITRSTETDKVIRFDDAHEAFTQ